MLDLTFLEKFTKGDPSKMKKYINLYLKMAPVIFQQIEKNIREQDWENLAINAHSLKPQADYMGIAELKDTLVRMENEARSNQTINLEDIYYEALQLHEKAVVLLQAQVAALE